MLTLSSYLKNARIKKKISREKLGEITKIKTEFIDYIESSMWDKLPEKPVVTGFVKSIASTLGVNTNQAVALLRRDFPDRKLKINPSPELPDRFSWSPKLTFLAGIITVIIIVLGYLIFQYINFISPPKLVIADPEENQVIKERIVSVAGVTDSNATLIINNQPVVVNTDGSFKTEIEISKDTGEIEIKAKSRAGKETIVKRRILVEIK
jgi:cytoskeletal protein RodZ